MLEYDFAELARQLAEKFECRIELPESWADYFAEAGLVSGGPGDRRHFARVRFRSPAVLEYTRPLPAMPRQRQQFLVYLKDISRSGVGFIHHEQLYPKEQMRLTIPPGEIADKYGRKDGLIEIARCTRVQDRCFVVGAAFVDGDQASPSTASAANLAAQAAP